MSYEIKSPLPGSILDIKVVEGQEVKEDETLLILEAMKMENEITTTYKGTVKKILVQKGQTVKAGDNLVEVE